MSFGLALCAVSALFPSGARAWVLQVPKGADFASLPQGRVLCGPVPEGWSVDPTRHSVKPKDDTPIGQALNIVISQHEGMCNSAAVEEATLIVTGDLPTIDANSVTVALDAGRLELRGTGLEGVRVGFSADDKSGDDVCLNVAHDRDREVCALNIDRSLPAVPHRIELRWAPPGGRIGPYVITYDKHGAALAPEQTKLSIARLLISRMFPDTRMVDVARGTGHVLLVHPEAVSGVDCGANAKCQVTAEGLIVGSVPAAAPKLAVRLLLLPHVFVARGDVFDNVIGDTLTVLRCPVAIVSGEPLRSVDELKVLVRLDAACVSDVQRLHFTANNEPSEVERVETQPDGVYVLLWVGRIASERLTIVASREDGSVLAVASEKTVGMPPLVVTLRLPGYGEIQFIPRNRPALVNVSHVTGRGELVPVSVPGAYVVTHEKDDYYVRGVAAGGYTALRFAYHVTDVPDVFADVDFGEVVDPVQRPIREASIPAPIGASSVTDHAIVELYCVGKDHKLELIPPGSPVHIPFDEHDSCRLVFHRERIPAESGVQRLDVEINVVDVGGSDRSEAHLSQHLALRHSNERQVVWIRGAKEQFDRINVHITHVIDESLYDDDVRTRLELPSSQWSVITESARFKFYATAAIPASLYRFSSDPQDLGSGPLNLDFGILTRVTWLDSQGHEGLIALEAGMMGMSLATEKERNLSLVGGFGIVLPIGNINQPTEAAVNIHAWVSYRVGAQHAALLDASGAPTSKMIALNHWAFVFGPSITVGSIGTFL